MSDNHSIHDASIGYDILGRLYILNSVRPPSVWRHFLAYFCCHESDTLLAKWGGNPKVTRLKDGEKETVLDGAGE